MRSSSSEYRQGGMAMKVSGRCHCGHISFEAEIDPSQVRICHCTDCQTLTGTAFRTTVQSLPGTFVLKSGTPKIYIKTADSGNKRAHAFCPECGTPIYAAAPGANPSFYGLRVGTLDRRAELRPAPQGGVARHSHGRWTSPASGPSSASHSSGPIQLGTVPGTAGPQQMVVVRSIESALGTFGIPEHGA